MRINKIVLLMLLGYTGLLYAQKEAKPSWLDTVPPQVTLFPEQRYHTTPFYIRIRTNEDAVIWVGIDSPQALEKYTSAVTISRIGRSVLYFYAEDLYGNKSSLDTASYYLDFQPPSLTIKPDPGLYQAPVKLELRSSEPCNFFRLSGQDNKEKTPVDRTFIIDKEFSGYIIAVDLAGNITRSAELQYIIDTSRVSVSIQPAAGTYNYPVTLSFKSSEGAQVLYSLDPNAPLAWFTLYSAPVACPDGLTLVRYFAKNKFGSSSALLSARYVVDTIAPKIKYTVNQGTDKDIVSLSTREAAEIRYALDEQVTFEESFVYTQPVEFMHTGRAYLKAQARDQAGNISERVEWQFKYDKIPPTLEPSHTSSTYTSPFMLTFKNSEPVNIFYTLDGSVPDDKSQLYRDGVLISKNGVTTVRYIGYDKAGNASQPGTLTVYLDFSPPKVVARIEKTFEDNLFRVSLETSESAKIYYEIGTATPTQSSKLYKERIEMNTGEVLRYFAIDIAGNRSELYTMDDLQKPIVSVKPDGGVYRTYVPVAFSKSMSAEVFWRLSPDTLFHQYTDTVFLKEEGAYTLEYYSQAPSGYKSPVRRNQYMLDWTSPRISINIKKGLKDSVVVFLECTENASIYYTTDGTSPYFSRTTRMVGNKFSKRRDRISLSRTVESKLALYAEDIAGNQSTISVLDIFKPHAIPNIPSGTDKVYSRIISVVLNTYDERSQIYFERHGKAPTLESTLFTEPITLLSSDTLKTITIDASGFKGDIETFIYLIDLPPSSHFTIAPATAEIGQAITFNASGSIDQESPVSSLVYNWDFDGNGTVDLERKGEPTVTHTYNTGGKYSVSLEVIDPLKRSAKKREEIIIRGICPKDMVFVAHENNKSFCVDKYEWPNKKGKLPLTAVSWIMAKMYCYDEGKRLCTADEWKYACSGREPKILQGTTLGRFPYGNEYEKQRCPTEGEKMYRSGSFENCGEKFGSYDMVGNAWEWVADNNQNKPLIIGGSYLLGDRAQCGVIFESGITTESENTGFRCCK